MSTPNQRAANKANAQQSSGPRTQAGQARSSQNAFKNGLASGRPIIDGEDPAEFQALVDRLLAEHQPATETESILVHAMAKHHWFENRAQRLQTVEFEKAFESGEAVPKTLAVLIRYETANHRAFHKSLDTLLKLKKQRPQPEIGFVSQNQPEPGAPNPEPQLTPEQKETYAGYFKLQLARGLQNLFMRRRPVEEAEPLYAHYFERMSLIGATVTEEHMQEITAAGFGLIDLVREPITDEELDAETDAA